MLPSWLEREREREFDSREGANWRYYSTQEESLMALACAFGGSTLPSECL
jgi:hypothetical protein